MGVFNFENIKNLLNDNYKIAIETGTFKGSGTLMLSKYFETVYTVEIDDNLFKNAKKRFKDNKNIICLNGDSKKVILKLTEELNNKDSNIFFWLDAHWSGDNSVDWANSKWEGYNCNTGHIGEKEDGTVPAYNQVPLEQEIINIYDNVKNECIIYIDDFDKIDTQTLKGTKNKCFIGEDWSHIDFNRIFNYINDRVIFKKCMGHQYILKFKGLDE